jgi:hypothetical protein
MSVGRLSNLEPMYSLTNRRKYGTSEDDPADRGEPFGLSQENDRRYSVSSTIYNAQHTSDPVP